MKRIIPLDVAKGICIILVVIGHYCPDNSPGWYVWIHDLIYSFHMPLFMFASGYLYMATRKKESYGNFLLKKIKRIIIPYFTVSVLVVTLKLLSQTVAYVENPVTWKTYLAILYSPSAAVFFWFIWALFIIFVIVPLFMTKTSRLILFFLSILFRLLPVPLPDIFCLPEAKNMLVYFMLGVILVDHKALLNASLKIPSTIVYILFFGLFYLSTTFVYHTESEMFINKVTAIIPFLGIYSVCRLSVSISHIRGYVTDWLLIAGVNSFTIYLLHTTFMGFVKAIVYKLPGLAETQNQFVFISVAAAIIITGIVFPVLLNNWILRKNKVLSFMFGMK